MASISIAFLTILGLMSAVSMDNVDESPLVDCRNSADCPAGQCCVIGPIRYGTPHCNPIRGKGETCRPESQPFNTTLYYPNNSKIDITNVHYLFCPCSQGLNCDSKDGTCKGNN